MEKRGKEMQRKLEYRNVKSYSLRGIEGIILKGILTGFVFTAVLMLTGCNIESSIEKQLADTMTVMNSAEKDYRLAQDELTELEKTEQQLFNETMKLTQQQQEELTLKVTELEALLGQRLDRLQKEEAAIDKAKATATDFDAIIKEADEQEKGTIQRLKVAVDERYAYHAEFIAAYKKLAALQEELYKMLSTDGTQLWELTEQVDKVNSQNVTVQAVVTTFNESTEKVNIVKEDVFTILQTDK
ncbi:YkyA family protein [Sporosarcina sp. NPDC096371]|uniref:YkyA family protein n=1 Tax=Sporosarcina sp. NPDC096371 TaxID=3364530 RepID=UPI003801C5B9